MAIVETCVVTGGVDTHADTHVAAALDGIGGLLGTESFPVSPSTASGSTPPPRCSSPPGITPNGSAPKPPGRTSVLPPPSPHRQARAAAVSPSTPPVTATPTTPCGASSSPA